LTKLVAIAGGTHAEGRGMEIWNPVKGTVEIVTPVLPKGMLFPFVPLQYTSSDRKKVHLGFFCIMSTSILGNDTVILLLTRKIWL